MELRQLRYFLALAEHRNFSRAAQVLGITQQALSYSIAQLEKSLQARLFDRTQNYTEMTEVGHALERRARVICGEAEFVSSEVSALRSGTAGSITFGVGAEIADKFLPDVIERFAQTRPKVTLTVEVDISARLYDRLIAAELEFVVATPAFDPDVYETLVHEKFPDGFSLDSNFLIMRPGHPLLSLSEPTLADAAQYPWVLPATLPRFTREIYLAFERAGAGPPPRVVRTDSFWCGCSIVRQTDFVALTGREAAAIELESGALTGFPVPSMQAIRSTVMSARARSPLQPATAALMGLFRSVVSVPG